MCDPVTLTAIAIGASVGAASSAATGGNVLQGALLGGATGWAFPGGFGVVGGSAGGVSGVIGGATLGSTTFVTGLGANIGLGGLATGIGGSLLAGAVLNPMFNPAAQTPAIQQSVAQQQNSQNIATTGSGGRQATASLADAIQRSKKRKLTQSDVGDLSIDTGSFANTGLQLA